MLVVRVRRVGQVPGRTLFNGHGEDIPSSHEQGTLPVRRQLDILDVFRCRVIGRSHRQAVVRYNDVQLAITLVRGPVDV